MLSSAAGAVCSAGTGMDISGMGSGCFVGSGSGEAAARESSNTGGEGRSPGADPISKERFKKS